MEYLLIIIISILFAMNMGGSGIAPSFSSLYGAGFIDKKRAVVLFGILVILGAMLLGRNVSTTIGKKIIPGGIHEPSLALSVIASATICLLIANILKIPQSTSMETVSAVVGAGLYLKKLDTKILLLKIIPSWIILPLLSFFLTAYLYKKIYPPNHNNIHIYEKLFLNEKKLKIISYLSALYVSFAIGTNNVANAVGPLYGAGLIGMNKGLLFLSPLFGFGAFIFGSGTLETAGKKVARLGLISSSLVSFITGSILLIASALGIPFPLVELNLCSIMAINKVKNSETSFFNAREIRKIFYIWSLTPILAGLISFALCHLTHR
jgi:phosphate/sulfate permease